MCEQMRTCAHKHEQMYVHMHTVCKLQERETTKLSVQMKS